jgi:tripartite-type tricarboxylate transporter receptor subunit TctC
MSKSAQVISVVLALAMSFGASIARAGEGYPVKPIRMIVVAGPGGTTDTIGRILGAKVTELLGQQVVVDPRPGGSGVVAADITANARPDGYTLRLTYTAHTINAARNVKLPYKVIDDFTPITELIEAGTLLTVNPASPPRTLREFVAWTKSYKGNLNVGVPGVGSGGYLAAQLYSQMTGVRAEAINHAGSGPALIGLMGGQYQYAFTGPAGAMALVRNGKLRAIAVTTPKRLPALPEIPALAEELPGFNVTGWWGILAPAHLPKALVVKLHDVFVKALRAPEINDILVHDAAIPVGGSPEAFRALLVSDLAKWPKLLKGPR